MIETLNIMIDWGVVATPILAAVGAALAGALTYGLGALAQWFRAKTKSEKLHSLIGMINNITETSIEAVNQTFVEELKAAGKFDAEAQKTAFNKTLNNIKKTASIKVQKELKENLGDVDEWLGSLIESKIESVKKKSK